MAWKGWESYVPPVPPSALPMLASPHSRHSVTRSKYGAVPHWVLPGLQLIPVEKGARPVGGIRFASKREAERFVTLRQMVERGEISGLMLQPAFELHVTNRQGILVSIGRYVADFGFQQQGATIINDAKGVRTPLYTWKKKHAESEYGIRIVEV